MTGDPPGSTGMVFPSGRDCLVVAQEEYNVPGTFALAYWETVRLPTECPTRGVTLEDRGR